MNIIRSAFVLFSFAFTEILVLPSSGCPVMISWLSLRYYWSKLPHLMAAVSWWWTVGHGWMTHCHAWLNESSLRQLLNRRPSILPHCVHSTVTGGGETESYSRVKRAHKMLYFSQTQSAWVTFLKCNYLFSITLVIGRNIVKIPAVNIIVTQLFCNCCLQLWL